MTTTIYNFYRDSYKDRPTICVIGRHRLAEGDFMAAVVDGKYLCNTHFCEIVELNDWFEANRATTAESGMPG